MGGCKALFKMLDNNQVRSKSGWGDDRRDREKKREREYNHSIKRLPTRENAPKKVVLKYPVRPITTAKKNTVLHNKNAHCIVMIFR